MKKSLVALIALIAFFSLLSVAVLHIDHDCSGDGCAICAMIQNARTAGKTLLLTASFHAICAHFLLYISTQKRKSSFLRFRTLVTDKVKLSS